MITTGIGITGNHEIDQATAEIAVLLRDACRVLCSEQDHYDQAANLRDRIMAGTRELDARGEAPSAPTPVAGERYVEVTRQSWKGATPELYRLDAPGTYGHPVGVELSARRAAHWAGQALGNMAVGREVVDMAREQGWARARVGGVHSAVVADREES